MTLDDTIAAIATAPGAAGLAVVRVSGRDAVAIAERVVPRAALAAAPSHTLHHAWAIADSTARAGGSRGDASGATGHARENEARASDACEDETLDEVVVALFRAPRSYTREDVVEISCHGGALPARRVLDALLAAGARLAGPGEFTLRAFLNGRLDLAQAEAVADLIHAETDRARSLALAQLSGALSRRIAAIEERVTDALAEIEARVDFAEDVGGIEVPEHVVRGLSAVADELSDMLAGAAYGRAVREGVRVPLVGRPNAGKSSLFNALVGEARAIVASEPGTTRDRVSEAVEIAGVRVTLSDTAGLRDPGDAIEAEGVARAREALRGAQAIVWVVDGSRPLGAADFALAGEFAGAAVTLALNKSDLPRAADVERLRAAANGHAPRVVPVSATAGTGIDDLRRALGEALGAGGAEGAALAVGNARHAEALSEARRALDRATQAARELAPGEIVALELREALHALGAVTGRAVAEDVLDRIFGRFCVGK
ncbi:MAG TPA: tRNA uridine-5-carboxymethylaminomethyl(34) synthesis GTPase MnmE [Candidatus Saccharimonadaceae bacterium]|nr:tRNA uridine-5-carboxymethylaminomethyl(34) synthesis GTPase MnmE [Candidatus Saccharimonadaceae bacterium]